MQPIEKRLLSRIYRRGRGWPFTKIDFVAEFVVLRVPDHLPLFSVTRELS
jgi:hypothetical protein